jgi:Ulp1 family protease
MLYSTPDMNSDYEETSVGNEARDQIYADAAASEAQGITIEGAKSTPLQQCTREYSNTAEQLGALFAKQSIDDVPQSQKFEHRQRALNRDAQRVAERKAEIASLQTAQDSKRQDGFDEVNRAMEQKKAEAKRVAEDLETKRIADEEAAKPKGPQYDRRIPLSAEEEQQIQKDMRGADDDVLVERWNIPVKKYDMKTLAPATWLNDEVRAPRKTSNNH